MTNNPHKKKPIKTAKEITKSKQPKNTVKEREERYRLLFNNISDPVFVQEISVETNMPGKFIELNEAAGNYLGYTREELLAMTVTQIDAPETLPNGPNILKRLLAEGHVTWEGIHLSKDGRRVPVEISNKIFKLHGKTMILATARDITERKAAEQKIHESERRLALASSIAHVGHWDRNVETGDLIWTDEVYRIFGYEPGEILPSLELFMNHINPKDRKRVQKAIKASESKPIPYNVEFRYRRKDGVEGIGRATGSADFDRDGRAMRISGAIQDITEIRRTEESLRESEEKYRLLFDGITDAVYVHYVSPDKPGKFIAVNEAACRMLGYTVDEFSQMGIKDIDVPEQAEKIPAILEKLFRDGYALFETEHIAKDDRRMPVEVNIRLINFKDTQVVLSVNRDITERKRAEEAIRESEAELHDNYFAQSAINMMLSESLEDRPLEEILQKALNMILSVPWLSFESKGSIHLVEGDQGILSMKAQHNLPEQLKKLCKDVPLGKCLCGKAALTQKIEFADHIDERHEICYEGIAPHGHYVVPILFGGRTLGVVDIYLKEGHLREQKEEEFLLNVADTLAGIIVRKQIEEEKEKLHANLLQAQKMEAVGQLSGGIAHDFNNILTAIIGFGNLLKIQLEKDSTLSAYIKHILDSADRAAKLIQDLLAFSRKQIISPKPINVNEVIKGVEKILLRLIGADIELSISLSDKDLTVIADSTLMENVLMNLATNARDAMPEGGNLLISSDFTDIDERFVNMYGYGNKGRYAVITISDTGVGIDEQTQDKIFEPFFTTKEVGKGTGLGLAMVYGIVKQHDGFINVYSETGKGTTFKIYLPLIHAEITATKEIELPISKGGIETILVAEDDALVRKLMREVVEGAGYTVREAKDGEDAIKVFNENKDSIKLLILDVIMPRKNGKEVYETLKESNPYIKALFTSGYSADILYKKGVIAEGPEVILKPISSDNLLRKIRDLLDQ